VVRVTTREDGTHTFYHDVLQQALGAAGSNAQIEIVPNLPQPRIHAMLEDGELSVHWFVRTNDRDATYIAVPIGLTDGLFGQRIFLIRPDDQPMFASVNAIEDLRSSGLVGGFGEGWYDVRVWQANGLAVHEEPGEWRVLYRKIGAARDANYFSRGVTEILQEAEAYPFLAIEETLLLVYDRDVVFYVSPSRAELAAALIAGVEAMQADGSLQAAIDTHFGPTLAALNVSGRTVLRLQAP
jgi:hypothetical protein